MTGLEQNPSVPASVSRLGDHWGVVVAYGVVTFLLGLVLAVWRPAAVVLPGTTAMTE